MAHALVFGSGFVGSAVVAALEGRAEVTVLDIATHPALAERGDAGRALILDTLSETRASIVINTAGRLRGSDEEMVDANVTWPAFLVDVLAGSDVRFVHLGSAAEYGDPGSDVPLAETAEVHPQGIYGTSKWEGTQVVLAAREAGLDAVVARGFNLVGPNLAPVSPLHQFLTDVTALPPQGGTVELWWPETVRDFITMDDLAEAVARLAMTYEAPPIVNLCSGVGVSFEVIVRAMAAVQGKPVEIASLDRPGIATVIGDPSLLFATTGLQPEMSAELIASRAGL